MSRTLLKRRLNPFLIASTILVLSLLAGLSVMWQGQLSNIQGENTELQSDLEEKDQRITELENQTSNLQSQLESTEDELDEYTGQYQQVENERDSLQNDVERLENTVQDNNERINNLEEERDDLNETVEDINMTLGNICEDENTNVTEYEAACEHWGHETE